MAGTPEIVSDVCFALAKARPLHRGKRPRLKLEICPVHRAIGAHGAHDTFVPGAHWRRPFACIGWSA